MPSVEVAVPVVQLRIRAVHGLRSETAQGTIVEAMAEGVTGGEVQTVRSALGKSRLEAVVVRNAKVRELVNESQVRILGAVWSGWVGGGGQQRLINVSLTYQLRTMVPHITNLQ